MGIFKGIIGMFSGASEYLDNNEKRKVQDEIDAYGLNDFEKKEVEKGNYGPYNFDEDDREDEDDYYHEDDE